MTAPARVLPPDARRSLLIYNLFFPLVFLALLPGFLLRMFRRGGFREKFGQRLGRFSVADLERLRSREWVWIHSISVGETFVALKLARALHTLDPQIGVLLSVTTTTGFAEARKAASDWLEPIYNPIDLLPIVRHVLRLVRVRHLIFIEAVWPNLVAESTRLGVPLTFIPRVSPRSERRFRRFRGLTGPIFRLIDRICVSDDADIDRWASLGAKRLRVIRTGSIKFDQAGLPPAREAEFRSLLAPLGVPPTAPILVAGSTWQPEEEVLAALLPALRREYPDLFLILVPRHVERSEEVHRQLESRGLRMARRSELPKRPAGRADLLLVDVTGELRDWYSLATVAFVGKSLPGVREVGGQNPGEPAALGKAVVFGPHMENFATLATQLVAADAATRIATADELEAALRLLLGSPERRAEHAIRASTLLAPHAGATARTASLLLPTRA